MSITGLYCCNCHPFNSWEECEKAVKQQFEIGCKVQQRHTGKKGEIYAKKEKKGYYLVKYGDKKSDIELEHAAMLVPVICQHEPFSCGGVIICTKCDEVLCDY